MIIHKLMRKSGCDDDILYLKNRLAHLDNEIKAMKEICQIKDQTIQDLMEELISLHSADRNN